MGPLTQYYYRTLLCPPLSIPLPLPSLPLPLPPLTSTPTPILTLPYSSILAYPRLEG